MEDSLYYIQSRPDVQIDRMGEFVLGKIGLFVNAENMLNIHQNKYNRLILRRRAPTGSGGRCLGANRGYALNGDVRFRFGEASGVPLVPAVPGERSAIPPITRARP